LFKKSSAILLTSLLTFSSVAAGAYTAGPVPVKPELEKSKKQISKSVSAQKETTATYAANQKVRVVVELEGQPAIAYAQQKGVKYSELSDSTKIQLESSVLAEQKSVLSKLSVNKINVKLLNQFTTVTNGFSAEVEYGKIKFVEAVEGVSSVRIVNEYQRPAEKPEMLYSKELIEAQKAWDEYGYKGEGMLVGVIDTGIDPSHRDMVLSAATNEDLTKEDVIQAVSDQKLPGKFYTEKVPYGYNYMDKNDTILDLGADASMHGMHVAGTVGANGDEANGGIKGVAPEAQLLALKVFGNDPEFPSTFGDVYVKAIDDAIKLGVDVINMSLGSTAGFVAPEDPEQKAVQRAVDAGVLMSISAGNSAHFGNGFFNPLAQNPDFGVSGSPGLAVNSLQVASYENSYMDLDAITFKVDGVNSKFPFLSASSVHPLNVETKTFQVADGGIGLPAELTNVAGKYALVRRGTLDFVTKAKNAQAAGALGIIVYNNAGGWINMATDPAIKIPQLFMLKTDGDAIKAALTAGKPVSLSFNGDKAKAANPDSTKMSAFTSWGLTPNLDFKPEITAPGGQILSTFNDNQYGLMSGTSMASPHVAGGSALVLQRVDEEFNLENFNRVQMAKNILMNTSKPILDKGAIASQLGVKYSPRRQGAGLMSLHAALSTPVVVTEATTNDAKVALKQINGKVATFTLKATNYSDAAVSYNVGVNAQTDFANGGVMGWNLHVLEGQPLEDVGIKVNGVALDPAALPTVEIGAGEEKEITVELDLTNATVLDDELENYIPAADVFVNGYFAEGFVTLTDPTDTNPELTIPYVGFEGKWDKAPILDAPQYDVANTFYGMTGLVDENGNFLGYNSFTEEVNPAAVAFSPNGDGVQDSIDPVVSFLRNAKKVEFNVLDKDGKKIRTIRTENNVRKNYYDGGRGAMYSYINGRTWNGLANLKDVPEGQYQYEIRSVIDFPGAEWQSLKFPVKVDLTAPTGTPTYSLATKTISFANVTDGAIGSGVDYYDVLVDGESVLEEALPGTTKSFKLSEAVAADTKVEVKAYDYAGNVSTLNVQTDTVIPDIHVLSPEAYSYADSREVTVEGYVTDWSGIHAVTVDGQNADVVYNETTKQYEFSTVLNFDTDGVKEINIETVDNKGNKISFIRTVFVDTIAPELNVIGAPETVGNSVESTTVSLNVKDNFDEVRVLVNGSEVYYNEYLEPFEMRSIDKVISDVELPLEEGVNQFVFEVTDLVGHKTTVVKEITRVVDPQDGQGKLTVGNKPLANTTFSFYSTGAEQVWYDFTTDSNGLFNYENLPDGEYKIDGVWSAPTWYELNNTFTITNGKVDGNPLAINALNYQLPVDASRNVSGSLVNGTSPLANVAFSLHSEDGSTWYDTKTDASGNFALQLSDGNYVVDGIWANGKWYVLNQAFTVANGVLAGLVIDVTSEVNNINVTGTLTKAAAPLSDVVFSIHTKDGDVWYDTQTDANGNFGFILPDGSYVIEGVWVASEGKWYVLGQEFTVSGSAAVNVEIQ
jgi:lactocepin